MHDTAQQAPSQLSQLASGLAGRGRPLPESTRTSLERSSGRLLGHVRIHDDQLASTLADAVAARAVTIGGHVALGTGASGQPGVLAHELAHAADLSATPSQGPVSPSQPGDTVEQSAARRLGE